MQLIWILCFPGFAKMLHDFTVIVARTSSKWKRQRHKKQGGLLRWFVAMAPKPTGVFSSATIKLYLKLSLASSSPYDSRSPGVTWISVANAKPAECEAISITHGNNNGKTAWNHILKVLVAEAILELSDWNSRCQSKSVLSGVSKRGVRNFLDVRKKKEKKKDFHIKRISRRCHCEVSDVYAQELFL